MASKRIDIVLQGTDSTGKAFEQVYSRTEQLKKSAGDAGNAIGGQIPAGANKAAGALGALGSKGASVFGTLKAGAAGFSDSLGGIGSAIGSLAGGFGFMEAASMAWAGSSQKQFNQAYMATKLGTQQAQEYTNVITKLVAELPGDDTYMNSLLSTAAARGAAISDMKMLGTVASDYIYASRMQGKALLETQMDIKEYILSGNTGQMERDSILKMQLDKLKGQTTVQGRIKALNEALIAEGYEGISQLDVAALTWDEVKGKIQLAASTVGEKLLPTIEKLLKIFLDLDAKTNGWSTTIGFVVVSVGLLLIALGPVIAATASAYASMKLYRIEAEKAAAANALNKGPPIGTTGGTVGKISDWLGTLGGVGAGAGLAVALKSVVMRALTGAAGIISKVGPGVLGPAFMGLFMEGSLFSGSYNFGAAWEKQFGKDSPIMQQFGNAFNAGVQGSLADQLNLPGWLMGNVVPAFQGAFLYIQGAWNNTVAFLRNGAMQIWSALAGVAGAIASPFISAWNRIVGGYNWMKSVVSGWISTGISVATGAIDWARAKWNDLKNFVWNNPIVGTVKQVLGLGPAGAARGPGIGLHYENYAGHKKNAWNAAGTGLSGNCVDMTLGLMAGYGGSMVSGTWNGGPHVWWQAPNGQQLDPARKAIDGTWTPPARGPGNGNFGNIVINGDVYGYNDFVKKVNQATGQNMYKAGRM